MNKKILIVFLVALMFGFISGAVETLGTFKQNSDIELLQSGANLTSCNITSVKYPNSSSAIKDVEMTKRGNEYNYTLNNSYTTTLGSYIVNGFCTNGTTDIVWAYDFDVTPSGESGAENIVFYIIILVILYGLTLLFFFRRQIELAPFTALSGMSLGLLGLYMIRNGIIIYRDWFSNNLSYVTIGIGFGLGLWSLIEWIEEQL